MKISARKELSNHDKAMLKTWEDTEIFWSDSKQTADRTSILEGFKGNEAFKYHSESLNVVEWNKYIMEKINDHEAGRSLN